MKMNQINNMNNMNKMNMNNMNMNNMNMNNKNMNNMNNMNMNNMNNINMNNMNMNNMNNMGMMNPMMMKMNMGMMNPMMMQMNMMNPMMMQMNMGMMNPMVNGGNMNMMTKEQIEEWKRQQRYKGYLAGKFLAQMKKNKQMALNPKPQAQERAPEAISSSVANEAIIVIKFKKGGNTTKIKMKSGQMIAELLNKYSLKTNNTGPFKYKGEVLDINDCSSLTEKGMKNGDEIIVG